MIKKKIKAARSGNAQTSILPVILVRGNAVRSAAS